MTFEKYLEEVNNLLKRHKDERDQLALNYALAHNSIKKGDIATDHIGSIRVEKILVDYSIIDKTRVPQCVYEGVELKKDGTPLKRATKRSVWQSNLNDKGL